MAKTGNELLSALRNTNVDFSQLAKLLDITPENRGTFWKNLIELLKNRDNPLDGNSGDSEALINNENSVFNFINYYCDLADKTTEEGEVYLSYIFDALKQIYIDANGEPTESESFWNYSVQEMVDHYMEYFCSETDQDTPLVGGLDYTRRHIKNANAGLSFKDTNWVEPNFNVNDKTYDQVRGHDEVNDILANAHKMQFTHTRLQEDIEGKGAYISDELTDSTYAVPSEKNANDEALNKWIRLLMPQYGRRVEIEDLDRNFWVIAQVIATLSGFLFDDDSPIAEMFKHLLNEVIQLWENVMYLWAEAAITSQKVCTNVRVITLPVPNTVEQPYRKFDNFSLEYTENAYKEKNEWGSYDLRFIRARSNENEQNNPFYMIVDKTSSEGENTYYKQALNQDEIRERVKFLINKYPDDNLIIIPFERLRNYKHNWYGCQNYRYVYTYHRGTNKWKPYRIRTYLQSTTQDNKNIYYYTYVEKGDELSTLTEEVDDIYDRTFQDIISGFPVTLAPIMYQNGSSDENWVLNHFSSDLYHANKIYGIRKDEDNYKYEYMSPFHLNESENIDEDTRYYGNLRVEVDVDYDLNLESLDLTKITFDVYDAAAPMIEGKNVKIATYTAETGDNSSYSEEERAGKIGYEKNEDGAEKIWLVKDTNSSGIRTGISNTIGEISHSSLINKKSLYMGETVSYYNDISTAITEIENIGTVEIPGYNQKVAPTDYSGGADNRWDTANEIALATQLWKNSSGNLEYNNVELISQKYIEENELASGFWAIKIIYPLGGQGGFSASGATTDSGSPDENYYYLDNSYSLAKIKKGNNTWEKHSGLISHGLYVKSEPLSIDRFYGDYAVTRAMPSAEVSDLDIFSSGLYLFKKKGEKLNKNNWAVVAIDSRTSFQKSSDGTYELISNNPVLNYVFVGYPDGSSDSYLVNKEDFSNEKISQYYEKEYGSNGSYDALSENYGVEIFKDYLTNLI